MNDDDEGEDDDGMLGCWDDAVGELLVEKGYRSFGPLTGQGHVAMIPSLGEHSAYSHPMVPPNPSVLPTRISIFVRSLSPFFSFIIVCANQKSRFFRCSLSLYIYICGDRIQFYPRLPRGKQHVCMQCICIICHVMFSEIVFRHVTQCNAI